MKGIQLRDYQALNKAQIRQAFTHHKAVLYQAGTGSGKTYTATSIIRDAVAKGSYVWFFAHRRELIEQTRDALYDMGVNPGIIMAGYRLNQHLQVQVCSIDTVRERLIKNDKLVITHRPDMLIIDECHRSLSKSYRDLFTMFPETYRLGLSATPVRSDGLGLGHAYEAMVRAPSVAELIEAGWLVQPRYFTGATADMEGVRTHNHDYARGEAEARMNQAVLRGDVVEQWLRHGERRKTIVFATSVKHSIALMDDFLAAGVRACHVDGKTLASERSDIMHSFRTTDEYEVLTNCMIATEGVDIPEVGCVVIACPTKIISKYLQMGGRCLRPHVPSGKKDCIIIDHGGNIARHGFLEDPVEWTLDAQGNVNDRIKEEHAKLVQIFTCQVCGCNFSGRVRCPECGTRLQVQGQHELISTVEELIEVTRGAIGLAAADKQKTYTHDQKRNFYAQVKGYAGGLNPRKVTFKDGWVAHAFRAKFGEWPTGMEHVAGEPPTPMVMAFIRAKNAAYNIRKKFNERRA
jgi:superfamily II DNA or RNA helicase